MMAGKTFEVVGSSDGLLALGPIGSTVVLYIDRECLGPGPSQSRL